MRQYLLATVFTVSATPALHATELLTEHVFSPSDLRSIRAEEFNPISGHEEYMHRLDFSSLTPSISDLGFGTLLDLTGYGSKLKQVTLPTSASHVRLPSGTKVIFVGSASALNLSKLQAESPILLDLKAVTGMDVDYGASSRNSIPSAVSHVEFPDNATEISVPVKAHTVIAKGAKKVHLHGDTFSGLPSSLSGFPALKELDLSRVALRNAVVNMAHLKEVEKLHLNPSSPAASVRLHGDKAVEMTGTQGLARIDFTSKDVTAAAITKAREYVAHVEVLHSSASHATVLGNRLDLHKRGDTTEDKASVVEAIRHMGIENIKYLKLKAAHLSYVMEKLGISALAGFTMLEKLELVDASGEYADATIGDSHITKVVLPTSIKEFYSKNSVIIKGALASGALDKKFNATHLDLSEATGGAALSAGAGFTASSVHHLHLPSDLDLSVAGTRTFTGSLSALTHLYTYGTSDINALQAANIPASVTHLDVSNSSATAVLPQKATITHVTLSAAYLAATGGANKFATFTDFAGAGAPANKTLVVKGDASGALTTGQIPNVGTVDFRQVTGATSFSAPINKAVKTNLVHLYLPESFDVTQSILANHNNNVTVYFSGAYASGGGSRTLHAASHANSKLNFSAVTGGGLFRVPATVRSLVLSSGVGGINGDAAAAANVFDLKALTQLDGLSALPTAATVLRINNSDGTAFGLDLSAHTALTELSLNASKLTHVHLPAARGLTHGGFGAASGAGHLNLSGLTGLVYDADNQNPIRGLSAFTHAAQSIRVISLPRKMPAGAHVDLSSVRSTISVRNLDKADRVTPHATAEHLVKPAHSHGIHDRTNQYLWSAYIEEMISPTLYGGLAETSLDISEVGLTAVLATAQTELETFFAALNAMPAGGAAGEKGYVQNIHIRVPDGIVGAAAMRFGSINDTPDYAIDLNPLLRVSIHKNAGLTAPLIPVVVGQISAANLHTDSADTGFDKENAIEWHSYLLHHLSQGKEILDLKDVTIGSDAHAMALQTALAALPSKLKSQLRGILVKLEGGDLADGSFATNADELTLDLSSLTSLEYLFVDLNETQDDTVNVTAGANITLPDGATLVAMNEHA